jgi:hypothetical protein
MLPHCQRKRIWLGFQANVAITPHKNKESQHIAFDNLKN